LKISKVAYTDVAMR